MGVITKKDQIDLMNQVLTALDGLTGAMETAVRSAAITGARVAENENDTTKWTMSVEYGGDKKIDSAVVKKVQEALETICKNLGSSLDDVMYDATYDAIADALDAINVILGANLLLVESDYKTTFDFDKVRVVDSGIRSITATENPSTHITTIKQEIENPDDPNKPTVQEFPLAFAEGPQGDKGDEKYSGSYYESDGNETIRRRYIGGNAKLSEGKSTKVGTSRTWCSASLSFASLGVNGLKIAVDGLSTSLGISWNEFVCLLGNGSAFNFTNRFENMAIWGKIFALIPGLAFISRIFGNETKVDQVSEGVVESQNSFAANN